VTPTEATVQTEYLRRWVETEADGSRVEMQEDVPDREFLLSLFTTDGDVLIDGVQFDADGLLALRRLIDVALGEADADDYDDGWDEYEDDDEDEDEDEDDYKD
jgi:hypothetical protein